MGPGKLVRRMQIMLYTYDEYLICIGLGPSISFVICKNLSYSGPSYSSSPVYVCQSAYVNTHCFDHVFGIKCRILVGFSHIRDALGMSHGDGEMINIS